MDISNNEEAHRILAAAHIAPVILPLDS